MRPHYSAWNKYCFYFSRKMMNLLSPGTILTAFLFFHVFIPVNLQRQIEGRRIRPYGDKCPYADRSSGGCALKDGYIEEVKHDVNIDSDKERPAILTRDDYPVPVGEGHVGIGSDYKPKPVRERPIGGGSGYNLKPGSDRDDYVPKPVDDTTGYNPKPGTGGEYIPKPPRGGGFGGGYNQKPGVDRDEYNPKPVGGGGSGGYNQKPGVDRDEYNPKPVGGGGSGGYNQKPGNRDEYNPKPVGGGGSGGYNQKPGVDRDEYNPKPVGGGGSGSYNRKPGDDRVPSGGGYIDKPEVDRDEYVPKPVGGGGYGGYNPKPIVDRPRPGGGGYVGKPDDDDYIPKPVGGVGGGYYPKPETDEEKPQRPDYGGYKKPKEGDYNDGYGIDGGIVDEDFGQEGKPIPVVEGNCICVPYYQCQEGHIVTDGAGIIDARKRPEPDEELPLDGKFKPPSCGPFHVCCNTPESSTVKPYEHRCGVRNPSGINSRILSPSNKGEADFGEWPWQAAVLKTEGKVNIFQCGGVLIDKYHVMTVAHCVFHLYKYNEYPLKVRLGEWDTQTTTEFLAHEDHNVSKIIVHPEFRNTSLWNDIALLRLEEPVFFAPHIDTICLPQYDEIFAGQNCVVTGWGKDAYKGGTFSNVMKEVALQVVDNYKCEEMLRKTRLGRFFQLHDGFLCAGGEYGLDSCKGDGGGPLVCYRKDKSYALAGLVSWGIDCGQPSVPGVYVKTQKYLEWISKNTGVSLQEYWPKKA
ncbi:phenoloxidase-activating factor 2 [Trichonephila clavipes]|nr:phenoloxidase-activating factor 2 [Trichonephila clavipes]